MLFKENTLDETQNEIQKRFETTHDEYIDDFYKDDKEYIKKNLMNASEEILFYKILNIFEKDYWIFPQVSLRTIIDTPDYRKTSKELYRTIDYVLFSNDFFPVLAIELHGKFHNRDTYTKNRDLSNEQILTKANIPLLTLWTNEKYDDETLKNLILNKIKGANDDKNNRFNS